MLELLLAELEATREERDSLRKEKHSYAFQVYYEKFQDYMLGYVVEGLTP